MVASGKDIIRPDVCEAPDKSLAQATQGFDAASSSEVATANDDFEYDSLDRSFLMTFLRALSLPHT